MTTIAYDGRYIAADGRVTMGSTLVTDSQNKFYDRGDRVFVLCGTLDFCNDFSRQFNNESEVKNKLSDAGGFLFEGGKIYLVYICEESKIYRKSDVVSGMWADGSGRDWAISAMDHGKSAVEAVKYAITRDTKSGGSIVCFDTKTQKYVKVKN